MEKQAKDLWDKGDTKGARKALAGYSGDYCARLLGEWWALSELLYVKYNDGYINTGKELAQPVFYPSPWLKQVGYDRGPVSYEKPACN